jgi:diguanylate cyclase (GGDEF)-like protein/hemerythrin-like metal-binding protein/PAS domain S-box-containing protein
MYSVQIFPWNKNLQTGIALIDEQHEKLVQLINLLASHFANQSDLPHLNGIFDELADYTVEHFHTEETIWHEFLPEDPLEAKHKEVHGQFVTAVLKLKAEQADKPSEKVIEDVLKFLSHWLVFHILADDMQLAKVVLAIQSGLTPQQAKIQTDRAMGGAMRVLIESILSMYDTLTARSLQLTKEVISRQKAEAKLRLAATVIGNTLDAICITDASANVIEVNPSFCETTHFPPAEVSGKNLKALKSGFADAQLSDVIWDAVRTSGHWSGEISSHRKDGEVVTEWLTLSAVKDEQGVLSNYVAVFSDITPLITKRKNMTHVAHHDTLTGLANRLLLSDRLNLSMAHAKRSRHSLAVCFLDLDGFKLVNDRLGHAAGDHILREVAQRLLNVVRAEDTVARLGGDEFVLLLGDLKAAQDYKELLDRVLQEVARPIQIGPDSARIGASIGVTLFPQDDSDADALIQHADQAMYQAKQSGKSSYHQYHPEATPQASVQ